MGQEAHEACPALEILPGVQFLQEEEKELEYWPARHEVHDADAVVEYVPPEQAVQYVALAAEY
jgi:hypothetical protein